jgi:hypothetical protein
MLPSEFLKKETKKPRICHNLPGANKNAVILKCTNKFIRKDLPGCQNDPQSAKYINIACNL